MKISISSFILLLCAFTLLSISIVGKGTQHMIDIARKADLKVHVVEVGC